MLLSDLKWWAADRGDPNFVEANYRGHTFFKHVLHGRTYYNIWKGVDNRIYHRVDTLTAQCVLNHITQGGNDDAG